MCTRHSQVALNLVEILFLSFFLLVIIYMIYCTAGNLRNMFDVVSCTCIKKNRSICTKVVDTFYNSKFTKRV